MARGVRTYRHKGAQALLWLALLGVAWLWLDYFLFQPVSRLDQPLKVTESDNARDPLQGGQIAEFHLFGGVAERTEDLSLLSHTGSSLNLSITGLLASDDAGQGVAYISNNQGQEKVFHVGDEVFGVATLTAVQADHAVLSKNGREEKLMMRKPQPAQASGRRSPGRSVNTGASPINQHLNTGGENWNALMQAQRFNPDKVADIVKHVSVVRNNSGQINGLRVTSLAGNNALLQQGLRAHDTIVAINGTEISPANILSLQSMLESADTANVTVLRNGRRMDLPVNLAEIKK